MIERRSNTGEVTPATVVHLDRALVAAVQEAQAYQLYQQTKSTTISRTLQARPPAVRSPVPTQVSNHVPSSEPPTLPSAPATHVFSPTEPAQEPMQEGATTSSTPATPAATGTVADQEPGDWATSLAARIAATLRFDLDKAAALVATAQEHGRGVEYLEDLLAYVQDNPRVDDPAVMFRRLVETNAVRRRTSPPALNPQKGRP